MSLRALLLSLLLASTSATAQMTNAETISTLGGRILGSAKACGIDGDRLRKTLDKVVAVSNARAKSDKERLSATTLLAAAYNIGIEQVSSGKTTCREASVALSDIEAKFARY